MKNNTIGLLLMQVSLSVTITGAMAARKSIQHKTINIVSETVSNRIAKAKALRSKIPAEVNMYKLETEDMIAMLEIATPALVEVSAEEVKALRDEGAHVINVLNDWLYEDCAIVGSLNMPMPEFIEKISEQGWADDEPIVVYCAIDECNGSEKAAVIAETLGFTKVYDFIDGIRGWYDHNKLYGAEDYPLQGPCAEEYLSMDREELPTGEDHREELQHRSPVLDGQGCPKDIKAKIDEQKRIELKGVSDKPLTSRERRRRRGCKSCADRRKKRAKKKEEAMRRAKTNAAAPKSK